MRKRSLNGLTSNKRNRFVVKIGILIVTSLLSLAAIVVPIAIRPSVIPVQVGDVANQDILAPSSMEYESEYLTAQAREQARLETQPIYLGNDPAITRRQIEKMRLMLNYISTIRYDSYASIEQKITDLEALEETSFDRNSAEALLTISNAHWQTVQEEALSVLEQVMRRSIRDDQLIEASNSIPTYISFSLTEEQATLVGDIVSQLVVPNNLYSEELTEKARAEAASAILPVKRSYVAGESIVRVGQIITPVTLEALQKYGLIQPQNPFEDLSASAILLLLLIAITVLYFNRRKTIFLDNIKGLFLVSVIFLIFLYGAKIIIPNRVLFPYLYPIPAFGLVLASLFNLDVAIIASLVLSVLSGYGMAHSLDLTLFYFLSSLSGILLLNKGRRISNFFWAGIAIGITGSAVILAYRLPDSITDWIGIASLSGISFLNGLASASLTLLFQMLFAQMLGMTTSLQLMELLRSDHPLLQHILRTMPGSYQHSLQVANLAEQAAESIGADALLTRVGAIYHDVGKSLNPAFFIENQVHGKIDSHEEINPIEAADTIIRHVTDGISLAKKYRLPPRIQDFMREHHGTLVTRYQYAQALNQNKNNVDNVDLTDFQYPGPPPQSKETAILMLADGVEARARAETPKNEEELSTVIDQVVEFCMREGQLINTNLTLRDITKIKLSFINTLRNVYHPRIRYPEVRANNNSISPQTVPSNKESQVNIVDAK